MKHPYLRLHAGVLLAGATGLFGRLVSVAELPLVFFRVLFSAIVFALIMGMQKKLHRMPLRHLLMIGGCGALLSIHWVFYYGSIKAANVSIGAVCIALVGFFTAIIEPLFFTHKRISWKELLLSLIAVLGIVLIFGLDARYRLVLLLASCLLWYILSFLFAVRRYRLKQNIKAVLCCCMSLLVEWLSLHH